MRATRRSRNGLIVAASVAVHAALLTLLALHAPRLRIPHEVAGPPEAVIPVLIMPRTPPPAAAPGTQPKPQPIRLHRRPQRFAPEDTDVKPLVAPTVEAKPTAPAAPGPRTITLPSQNEDAVAVNARKALRGKLGCANANLLNLSRAEREKCEEELAAGATQSDYLGTGVDADKAGGLAAAARRKEADFKFKRTTPQAAPGGRIGSTATDLGKSLGNDNPTLKVPF